MKELEIENLLNLKETIAISLFKGYLYPWEVLSHIGEYILKLGDGLDLKEYNKTYDDNEKPIWIHKTATIANFVTIEGPTIIDKEAIIKHCAYIRGNVIIGQACVVGNSSEIKNAILFNEAKAPHFNYIGDSVLGHRAHLGAGVKISNFKSDGSFINIKTDAETINTNLKKFGAILGDNVEIGCNAVTNPGTIIGKNSTIYPCLSVRGIIRSNKILKNNNLFIIVDKKQ